MPVKHIVLMKFKADTPAEALEKASANLLALKGALETPFPRERGWRVRGGRVRVCFLMRMACVLGKVPGILDVTFGATFTHDRSQGYTHALVVDLADKAALDVSVPLPARAAQCLAAFRLHVPRCCASRRSLGQAHTRCCVTPSDVLRRLPPPAPPPCDPQSTSTAQIRRTGRTRSTRPLSQQI